MKTCKYCDESFLPSTFHPNQSFCSRSCGSKARGRILRGFPIKRPQLMCLVCDKTFYQKRLNNTQYCSSSCKRLAATRKRNGLSMRGPKKHIKGSGYITTQGYKILSLKHPNASKRGQILEHVLIMSKYLDRPLNKDERVHHKNGIRNDNRIENLELWSHSHPPGQRVDDKIQWCKKFLEIYGYKVINN